MLTASSEATVAGAEVRGLPRLPEWGKSDPAARKALWHLRDQWRPAVYRAVVRELRGFRPDVVHSHSLQGISASPLSAVSRLGLPHVHTAHDLNLLCMEATMTRGGRPCRGHCAKCRLQRRVRGRAAATGLDRFIAPSRYLLDRHVEAGVALPASSEVIRHGTPAAPAKERAAPGNGLRLGFIGTLAQHKGVPTLLRAIDEAPDGWRLLVAGAGPLEPQVRQAARTGRLEYLGHVSGAARERFYDSTDVLVVPSECEESASLVVAEAAVRGLPAVVSDRGALPEAPEAQVFHAGDAGSLILAARALAASLPDASRRLIARRREFLWDAHLEAVERVLEQAVASRRAAVDGDGVRARA